MRVLHINSNYMHSHLHSELLGHLELLDVDNDVIMARKVNDEKHCIDNLNLNHVHHKQFLKGKDRLFYFAKQNKIEKWIKSLNLDIEKHDIIHAHTLFTDGYAAYKLGKPYVITVRNTDLNFFIRFYKHLLPLGRKILKHAHTITFLSESYKDKTINILFKSSAERKEIAKKTVVIPNGINDFWINNQSDEKKKLSTELNILCVSRVMKNKNIEFLARHLNEDKLGLETNIYVIGEILDHQYYRTLSSYKNMNILGRKSKEEIKNIMKKMDVFALVSFSETFGLVYLEALTQNLPLIYTKEEGFDRYFEEGYVGYPVLPNEEEELINSVLKIINRYEYLQDNISQIDKNQFSWYEVATQYKKIYKRIKGL
ncbi:glycosyltransferase family 4 protein [Staphylococcus pseudintermedius]|uniref:glycosyltransferase family 4 protein n=1 Tax=Staphylococcus pseudintermedius TaxID=283734 RepID=UPI0007AE6236|nr:glycosyltransferase family 4 protein [Staphylococcus pseudintermedius]EGQ1662127.1 glycosyltransferase [Staphylococcus pseudintermedius]EGQ3547431.1 glycosyltransferase family 4 protein [Staphylococcus pseudintermedius]EGQ3824005.1 glycosyltransferase family 4 protein [Staphylococcus pseudintermedius]EGQ4157971.1 glycosyltransferase family 4 protein [Staphylococcus pseudintermedius]EHD0827635.1 glycosyltransferase family 4 protein [Staphylococcus pseudintermedius]